MSMDKGCALFTLPYKPLVTFPVTFFTKFRVKRMIILPGANVFKKITSAICKCSYKLECLPLLSNQVLCLWIMPVAYLRVEHLSAAWVGSGPNWKHETRLERHFGLLQTFIHYGRNKSFITSAPGLCTLYVFESGFLYYLLRLTAPISLIKLYIFIWKFVNTITRMLF